MQAEEKHDINVKMQDELRAQRAQAEYKAKTDYKTVGCEAPEKDPEPEELELAPDGLSGPPIGEDHQAERRRVSALDAAAMVCGENTMPQTVVSVAKIFESYLKGD